MEYTVKQIRQRLLSVTETKNENGEIDVTKEFLKTYRILFAMSGGYEVYWERNHVEVPTFGLFFFIPGNRYTVRTGDRRVELLDLRFEMTAPQTQRPMLSNPAPDLILNPEKHVAPIVFRDYKQLNRPFCHEVSSQTARAMEMAIFELQKDMPLAQELADLYLYAVLMNLMRDIEMKPLNRRPNATAKIMRYVNAHLTEPIYNEVIGKELSYHPNYINRVIKEETGIPFRKYVAEEKLHYAAMLLLTTNKSITEIAFTLCFHSSSHFSSLFTEKYHCTPSEYRKKYYSE